MGYSVEKNVQILLSLMKQHGIRKVILSPGTTNMNFAISVQQDDYFETFSCVDERSAAYMACGMVDELNEPVVISCTGATASRNYLSGLTEAYYRHLPVIAITSTRDRNLVGNNFSQVIDRSIQPHDVCRFSTYIPIIKSSDDEWEANLNINKAFIECKRSGGGPVHINLATRINSNFSVDKLPRERLIKEIDFEDDFPVIPNGKIVVFVGNYRNWSKKLITDVDTFCERYNAVVLHDLTGKYQGNYGCNLGLICDQDWYKSSLLKVDLCIYFGNVSGMDAAVETDEVWQISRDGIIHDLFQSKTTYIFSVSEEMFFERYNSQENEAQTKFETPYYIQWKSEYEDILKGIGELPLSTGWVAQNIIDKFPSNSFVYLGIYNCLRNFNYFGGLASKDCYFYSNTGGFGIDGGCSSTIGASVIKKEILHFGIIGDLGFFYDMNSLGNKHIMGNIRLMVINNSTGMEMELYTSAVTISGCDSGYYCSARGHNNSKSNDVVKHFAEDMGFEYIRVETKKQFLASVEHFVSYNMDMPMLMEIFTTPDDENEAMRIIRNQKKDKKIQAKEKLRGMLSENQKKVIKGIIHGACDC